MERVRCPSCLAGCDVRPEDLGHRVECPNCRVPFTPRTEIEERAKAILRDPANGLFWAGVGGVVTFPLVGAGFLWLAEKARNDPKTKDPDDVVLIEFMGVAVAAVGVVYSILMAAAAQLMKRGTNARWAYAAAGLGVGTVVIWGPCLPVTWAALPYGIMGLLAIGKAYNPRRGRERERWTDDRLR
jgi:hypothetical protein